MRALQIQKKGEGIVYTDNNPIPTITADEVLVKIHAAALNHRDVWITKGMYGKIVYPCILGADGAGVVLEIGENVDKAWKDAAVIINPNNEWGNNQNVQQNAYHILGMPTNGTLADYLVVKANRLHPKPAYLSWEEAAAVPLAGLTAYRALFSRARIQPTDKVLITGIGGGVAQWAALLAKSIGCTVYITSGDDEKLQRAATFSAGGVNYKTDDWQKTFLEAYGEMNVIIDSAGGVGFSKLLDIAAPAGRIVFYGGGDGNWQNVSPQKIFWKQLSIMGTTMGSDEEFEQFLQHINTHQIHPLVDTVFPAEDGVAAFARMATAQQFGKIVVRF